ncbi:MAG TPA: Ppx/GppA phosphatase family protein [Candidatus Binatia bacterium]|jgi:exopolyphosphatase/guanosine-5'-triphosphate,3'-diphosphate pyrophosphatase
MSPRRSAFIDVGTNTILCLIAEIRDTGRFRVLDDLAEIAGLGKGVDQTGVISTAGEQRSLAVLERYLGHCKNLGVDEIIAVGTSALRDAKNSAAVRARFRDRLGIDVRVISGDEEAAYSFLAVERGLALAGRELLVIDIGGGSTEFIRGNEAGISRAISVDIGSVRLTERYLYADPVSADEVQRMLAAIDRELAQLPARRIAADAALTLVGIAGTFTTLAAMEKQLADYSHAEVHGGSLTLQQVRRQLRALGAKTVAERKRIIGLDPKRADVIFAGACLIERIMIFYHADAVIVGDQGVRYGLLHEAAKPQ